MSRENLCNLIEGLKSKITSKEYKDFMDELALLKPLGEQWKIVIWYADLGYSNEMVNFEDEVMMITSKIDEIELYIKSDEFDDNEQYDAFKKLQQRCCNPLGKVVVDTLCQILPYWYSRIVLNRLKKSLSDNIETLNNRVLVRIIHADNDQDDFEDAIDSETD